MSKRLGKYGTVAGCIQSAIYSRLFCLGSLLLLLLALGKGTKAKRSLWLCTTERSPGTVITECRKNCCELQLEKMYLLTCAQNEDSNQPAPSRNRISLRCPHYKSLHPRISKMHSLKILIGLCDCAG